MDRRLDNAIEHVSDARLYGEADSAQTMQIVRSCRDDALEAIAALGALGRRRVPPAATLQFGHWLDWPDWFKHGTSLTREPGLPNRITVADDLNICANIVDNGEDKQLLNRLFGNTVVAAGSITTPALYNAPDMRSALALMLRSTEAATPYIKAKLIENAASFSLEFSILVPAGKLRDFIAITALLAFHRLLTFFEPHVSEAFNFDLAAATDDEMLRWLDSLSGTYRLHPCSYILHGPAKWLDYQNPNADLAFWTFAKERQANIEREYSDTDLIERLRIAIRGTMAAEKRVPRLKQLAAEEGISERTLIRALAMHRTSFHEIAEEERRYKAAELIGNSSKTLSEIAADLGFTDMSSFGRSFRQWFGMTPGQFRKPMVD
jgi:AraC-like DNA-binding protein